MNLEALVVINLYQNDLKGSLEGRNGSHPAVCNITHGKGKLKVLNLELNFIEGELPACIFDSTSSLREIVLGMVRTKHEAFQFGDQVWELHTSEHVQLKVHCTFT